LLGSKFRVTCWCRDYRPVVAPEIAAL
jgi:hypothetical protein